MAGRRIAIVVTPIVAIATLALGLRVGARQTVHAAMLYGAPEARGGAVFAWQLVTIVDDRGVRETESLHGVTVRARAATGPESTWTGDTNADGVAEVRLDLPGVARGEAIDVEVRAPGIAEPLARGRAAWGDEPWMREAPGPLVRASKREGALAVDVAILGGQLVASFGMPVAMRVTSREDGRAVVGVTIDVEPEPGLEVTPPHATPCPNGWARFMASPQMHVASASIHARAVDGREGHWFGALPVAPGAMEATVDGEPKSGEPFTVTLRAASERTAYLEIDDDTGRAFATSAALTAGPFGPMAHVSVPPMGPGLTWIVTSGEPRGGETLAGATLARPLLIPGTPMPAGAPLAGDSCGELAYLALHPAGGFARWTALDGFTGRAAANAARRKRGLLIALGSMAVASLLELILLLDASARARADMERAASSLVHLEDAGIFTRRSGAGSLVISVLVALLGFGLFAALLLYRAG